MDVASVQNDAVASAIIVPCASRKCVLPDIEATAVSLERGTQETVETAWLRRLTGLPKLCRADELYRGRGFKLACRAAASASAPLYVASAGLGLVAARSEVPTYGVTVNNGTVESVAARVDGPFDALRWWDAISTGPFAVPMADLPSGKLPIVVALTRPYARMISAALTRVRNPSRLRLIGSNGLASIVPLSLRGVVVPYDDRLEALTAGTRADFPHRALVHFVEQVLARDPNGTPNAHACAVTASLAGSAVPDRPVRPRRDDDAIRDAIRRLLGSETGSARLLRRLRTEDGIACEQARFGRLYREVLEDGPK